MLVGDGISGQCLKTLSWDTVPRCCLKMPSRLEMPSLLTTASKTASHDSVLRYCLGMPSQDAVSADVASSETV